MRTLIAVLFAVLLGHAAVASQDIPDQYPGSMLYSKPVEVIPHVWSAIGATSPPTYENAGHNNNLSFIVTGDGVVVVNGGGAYLLAKALHDEIKKITDQPVKLVINENGQGHAMLGNSYWIEQDVPILAHVDAEAAGWGRGDTCLRRPFAMTAATWTWSGSTSPILKRVSILFDLPVHLVASVSFFSQNYPESSLQRSKFQN